MVRGADIDDCDGTPCGSTVCANGGTCLTGPGTSFSCRCTQVIRNKIIWLYDLCFTFSFDA